MFSIDPVDEFFWECEIQNVHSDITLYYANQVYSGEMCNVFGFFSTSSELPTDWACTSF